MNSRLLAIIAAAILAVSFVLYAVANGVPSWGKVKGTDSTIGLWQVCGIDETGGTSCEKFSCTSGPEKELEFCKKIIASRAFVTLVCIISSISAILLVVLIVGSQTSNQIVLIVIKILPIICLVMGIIGVALGANATTSGMNSGFKLGPAAIIGIVAIIMNFFGAVVTLLVSATD